MRIRGLTADEISYSAAGSACSKQGQWQLSLVLFASLAVCERVMPDLISCNAAISAWEKGGQWPKALTLLLGIPQVRATADIISYDAVISACEKDGAWQLAVSCLSYMSVQKVLP
ncbi:unnamed protein product, partial [Polarella glacialis]